MKLKTLSVVLAFLLSPVLAYAASFTDSSGRVVVLPDHISKVMAAGPPASVLIYVLAPEKLAGWVREPGPAEKEFLLPSVLDLPTYGRLAGKGGTANIEAVLKAKPDLIIDIGTINDTYKSMADKVQQQTGIPYILIDGSFAKTVETLKQVGDVLGAKDRATLLSTYADEKLKALTATIAGISDKDRPNVYYGRGPKGLETGLAGSINMELLEAVGAKNVAAAAGKGGLSDVSLEQVLGWDPDIILADNADFALSVKTDSAWSGITAVKSGKIFKTPSLPFGWIDSPPGVNRLIGVTWLESVLYPMAVKVDLKSEVKSYFKLFYQVDVTDTQIDTLLSGAGTEH